MNKQIFLFITLLPSLVLSLLAFQLTPALADVTGGDNPVCDVGDTSDPLGLGCAHGTGLSRQDPRVMIGQIIKTALGLLGMIAIVLVIFAGFKWMTAAGKEESVTAAKDILTAAVIGLVIILSAYTITNFVVGAIGQAARVETR